MTDRKILNEEQIEAIEHGEGPLLIIAGAGTGKTTVITQRIKHLILEKNIHPSNILALTFTEKSAREMEERIDMSMPYGYTQLWISTFHAFCDRILRLDAIHIGLNPSYQLATEAESIMFLKKNIFKLDLDYFRPLGNPNKFLEGLLNHFSRLKDEDVSPIQYLEWVQNQKSPVRQAQGKNQNDRLEEDEIRKNIELANAYKTYEDLKVKEGIMDFSDLLSNTLKLLRTRKNILKKYQDQFEYILVDEFQDTNFAQNQLAILLAGERKNITVVGDDDQAIYRWRGAAISNIIQFRKYFPKTKVIALTKNYRSTEEILNKSYRLIQNNNPDRLEVREKVDKKLVSAREIPAKGWSSFGRKGEPVELLFGSRVEDEADMIAKKITDLAANYKYSDIAILIRANDHSQAITRSLERHDIPYQFLGPGELFQKEEIKDLIAYLKVLYNHEDSTSLYRVLTMPIFGLEAVEISTLLNFAKRKNLTLFQTLGKVSMENGEIFLKDETKEKMKNIYEMIKGHLEKVPTDTCGQILYFFLQESGILEKSLAVKEEAEEKKVQNIAKFFDKLKTYEAEHEDASVFAVVDWIDLLMQMGESPLATDTDWTNNNAVNILTIHSSKGLEFPVVFLINLVTQRFPTRERKEQIPIPSAMIKEILPEGDYHIQEERRLFYVGTTRARDRLFLTAANFYGEGKRERKISPFVIETLGEEQVKKLTMQQSDNETIKQLSLLDFAPQIKETSTKFSTLNSQLSTRAPITYLSYSQIQTFDICPLHYKLKYILKVPTPSSPAQSFGTSVHSSLRDFYQNIIQGVKSDKDQLLQLLEKNWINEGYESRSHELKALEGAKKILANYYQNSFNPKIIPAALEQSFKFSLRRDNGSHLMIGGRIDRIDSFEGNKIEIIDYKTGNNTPEEKKLKEDWQLTFYALAATEVNDRLMNRKAEDVTLSLFYIEQNKKFTTTRTMEQLAQAKKKILEKAEEIANSDFTCSKHMFCKNCEYKILCRS